MTSGCYVYAILSSRHALPAPLHGLAGAEIFRSIYRELAAAVSTVEPAALDPTPAALLQHEAAVETIRCTAPALPVRFGTILTDVGAVACALAGRYDVLTEDLRRLGSAVEFGLAVLWPVDSRPAMGGSTSGDTALPPGVVPREAGLADAVTSDPLAANTDSPTPGTRYLLTRLAEEQQQTRWRARASDIAHTLDDYLRPLTRDSRSTLLPTGGLAVRTVYLLDTEQVDAFRKAFERLRRTHADLRLLLSGPWAPYSFVTVLNRSAALSALVDGVGENSVRRNQ
ncbi:MAG: GvpL/GvpF family gas vesicle protein [Chloroflexi bacterium]|nr:GvpL/GvpF family gas vesicle protein [Chloroflexota bacterium]